MRSIVGVGILISLVAFMSCASNPEGARDTTTDNVRRIMTNESSSTTVTAESSSIETSDTSTTFTVEEVMSHNTEADCYGVVSGKVYDFTAFADLHPGGRRNVLSLCGKDYTNSLMRGHPGGAPDSSDMIKTLEPYYLGELAS